MGFSAKAFPENASFFCTIGSGGTNLQHRKQLIARSSTWVSGFLGNCPARFDLPRAIITGYFFSW